MNITFESDFKNKVLYMSFDEKIHFDSPDQVFEWRSLWMKALATWHTPYSAVLDASNLTVASEPELKKSLQLMVKVFKGLFLKKIVAFGFAADVQGLPFDCYSSREAAMSAVGVRSFDRREVSDFRSLIQFDNQFQQQVVELSFLDDVVIESEEQVNTLKDKLTNNLMLWHSAWHLIIDCSKIEVAQSQHSSFHSLERFFKGFFLKKIVGYQPKSRDFKYPFPVFLSRHKAAIELETQAFQAGDKANCSSRK